MGYILFPSSLPASVHIFSFGPHLFKLGAILGPDCFSNINSQPLADRIPCYGRIFGRKRYVELIVAKLQTCSECKIPPGLTKHSVRHDKQGSRVSMW